jgi:hypothetical protein
VRGLRWPGLLATLALASLPARAIAQAVGSEFQANTYTTSHQRTFSLGGRAVAADASGNFVVVWRSFGQDGNAYGIFGQRYDSAGGALGGEFRVNSYTTNNQLFPSIASDASGNFVVVWESYQDGDNFGIFGQRYDSAGSALGNEFRVNSYTTARQTRTAVAADPSGNFVVVWGGTQRGDYDVFGQRFDSAGKALGSEFRVNSHTTSSHRFPSVASDATGNFVVVWTSYQGGDYSVLGKRYDSAGVPRGAEFRVNSYMPSWQKYPSVACNADGNFLVAWQSWPGQDGNDAGIFGQRFDSAGNPVGDEFRVNSYTTDEQEYASVASDADGNFVVVWHSYSQDAGSIGVFGQRYDSAGVALGGEFQINAFTTNFQAFPSVAAAGANQFVVAWESHYQDGSGVGVFGRRFDFAGDTTPPSVTVAAPNGGERLFTGSSYLIEWAASDDTLLASFDVSFSGDGGGSFLPIAECQDLPESARSCLWLAPGPPSVNALIRVGAEDTSGNSASDDSDAIFRIVAGTGSIIVTSPNTNVRWRIGSLQAIRWTHNLGLKSRFRIELDRNDDGTFEELIAAAVPAGNPTNGNFSWVVTGPPTLRARMRVSWTSNPGVSDVSNVTFRIGGQGGFGPR